MHLVLLGEERQLPVLDLQHELADVDKRLEVDVLRDLELVQVKVEGVVVLFVSVSGAPPPPPGLF